MHSNLFWYKDIINFKNTFIKLVFCAVLWYMYMLLIWSSFHSFDHIVCLSVRPGCLDSILQGTIYGPFRNNLVSIRVQNYRPSFLSNNYAENKMTIELIVYFFSHQ